MRFKGRISINRKWIYMINYQYQQLGGREMEIYFLGAIALVAVFFVITYAVRIGIDTSKQMQAIRREMIALRNQIKRLEEDK